MERVSATGIREKSEQDRGEIEARARAAVKVDGRQRLKRAGKSPYAKTEQILYRCSLQKRGQLIRIADKLSIGKLEKVTLTETLDKALDALEREENARKEGGP
jgi:hypothetical protein